MKRLLWPIVLLCALPLVSAPAVGADFDRWYELEIAGQPCGFMHESSQLVDGVVKSTHEEQFVVARDGRRVEVYQQTIFEETPRGEPLRARVEMRMGPEPAIMLYEFTPDGLKRTRAQHGRTLTDEVELSEEPWLTPVEAAEFVRARLQAGADRISYHTIEPTDGMRVIAVQSELIGTDELEVHGRVLEVSRWRTRTSGSPIDLIELRADDGTVVFAEADIGIGAMTLRLVDRARARGALDARAPELLTSTIVPVDGMPARSERLEQARYLVRADMAREFTLPDSGAQRVRVRDDGTFDVEVDVTRGSVSSAAERGDDAYLASSALVDAEDPEILKFTQRALRRASEDPRERAEILRAAVRRHMSRKDFATAFGSASDAVRTRSGDCTEHAVLLAAVLRASDIPSRVATGLVHTRVSGNAGSGFAWHMWTQALIDDRWIDLDPTRPISFDAGHLTVSTASLQEGSGQEELSGMLPLLGRLRIEVIEVDHEQLEGAVP